MSFQPHSDLGNLFKTMEIRRSRIEMIREPIRGVKIKLGQKVACINEQSSRLISKFLKIIS